MDEKGNEVARARVGVNDEEVEITVRKNEKTITWKGKTKTPRASLS